MRDCFIRSHENRQPVTKTLLILADVCLEIYYFLAVFSLTIALQTACKKFRWANIFKDFHCYCSLNQKFHYNQHFKSKTVYHQIPNFKRIPLSKQFTRISKKFNSSESISNLHDWVHIMWSHLCDLLKQLHCLSSENFSGDCKQFPFDFSLEMQHCQRLILWNFSGISIVIRVTKLLWCWGEFFLNFIAFVFIRWEQKTYETFMRNHMYYIMIAS